MGTVAEHSGGKPDSLRLFVGIPLPPVVKDTLIDDLLFALGIEPDRRVYTPHITLARCTGASAEMVGQAIKRNRGFAGPPFRVDSFHLVRSRLRGDEPEYRVEEEYGLD